MNDELLESIHKYSIDLDRRVVFLHGSTDNSEDSGVNWQMANTFLKNLYLLDLKPSSIIIHQHNIGGDYGSGMMIYDGILKASSYSVMVCHGETYSMGSVILQAADLRLSMPSCTFMVHDGQTIIDDNYKQVQSYIHYDRECRKKMIEIYANRCQRSPYFQEKSMSNIKKYINTKLGQCGDWYMNAHQALEYGFIDGIIGEGYELKDLNKL